MGEFYAFLEICEAVFSEESDVGWVSVGCFVFVVWGGDFYYCSGFADSVEFFEEWDVVCYVLEDVLADDF